MIKTIIFDFGDVFINLDKEGAMANALQTFGVNEFSDDMIKINTLYEQGLISTNEFLEFYQQTFPLVSKQDIIDSWNVILKDFPLYRLNFLKQLASKNEYKLILLSNTNALHINWVKESISFYPEFKNCFGKFYLSHEIQLRKSNHEIYQFVLQENDLIANETLFIDDTTENTNAANELNIIIWNLNPKSEDITDLFSIKKELF